MPTFLIIVGVFLGFCVFGVFSLVNWLKTLGARGLVLLAKVGIEKLTEDAKADYVSGDLRGQLAALKDRFDKGPAPGYWTNRKCIETYAVLLTDLAELADKFDKLKKDNTPATTGEVIDVTAEVVEKPALPAAELPALPAPTAAVEPGKDAAPGSDNKDVQ